MISVVIPTLNAADSLPCCLAPLNDAREAGLIGEVVVADGGSSDETAAIAEGAGCDLARAPKGRGSQLAAGARTAQGDWLLFLHADTILGRGWAEETRHFMARDGARDKAGVFRFALDDPHPSARRIERLAALRIRLIALPYGDQGLVVHRTLYEAVGGFADMPLMEDVDLIRRLKRRAGRRSIVQFTTPAVTSAERYQRGGYLFRPLRNLTCLSLYFLGVPPRLLARLYG